MAIVILRMHAYGIISCKGDEHHPFSCSIISQHHLKVIKVAGGRNLWMELGMMRKILVKAAKLLRERYRQKASVRVKLEAEISEYI